MSFRQALIVSCDTVFYDLAYDIWIRTTPGRMT